MSLTSSERATYDELRVVSDTTSCTSGQCIDARPSRNRGINLPSDSGAEDVLFDYLDAEEGRIYNDLARHIRSVWKRWKAKRLSNATAASSSR